MYENEFQINENTITVTGFAKKGPLPDLFTRNDGRKVKTPADWEERREEIKKTAVELQYGTMPPAPTVFSVDQTYLSETACCYRITAGTKEKQVTFYMKVLHVKKDLPPKPAVITGDLCWNYAHDKEYVKLFTDNEVNLVLFDRTELAADVKDVFRHGALYDIYPEYTFGAIGAWAWGYSRCVDALQQIGGYDMAHIAFTGHSRGGKTALLAGALDTRAFLVNANAPCQGGAGSYRFSMTAINEDGEEKRSEPLANICEKFPDWLSPEMKNYIDKEETLPFDAHFLKALIAPRIYLDSEGASDIWANPVGTYLTTEAARDVYRFLGCEDRCLWYFRRGKHAQKPSDIYMLINTLKHFTEGAALNDYFYRLPFSKAALEKEF